MRGRRKSWLRKYLELPYGIPTDDTFRILSGYINADHFFELTMQLLIQAVSDIIILSSKEKDIHKRNILSVDGKESRSSKRKRGIHGEPRSLEALNVYSSDYGTCVA